MAVETGAPSGSARIVGLDSWRAGLMLGGLLVHGAIWQDRHWLFDAVELVSHSFRMGTFFAISGFLAACSMQRRAPDAWLRKRLTSLGIPFVFGMATIAPLMWWLAQLHGGVSLGASALDWHHLWFLPGLILYSVLAARWAEPVSGWIARVMPVTPSTSSVLLLTALLSSALLAFAGASFTVFAPASWLGVLGKARLIAGYLPMFALGFLTARHAPLREALVRGRVLPVAVLASVAIAYLVWFVAIEGRAPGDPADPIGNTLATMGQTICPPAVFALVLQTASRVQRVPRAVSALCDASYTVYLVHLPLLAAINTAFVPVAWPPVAEYTIAVVLAGGLSLLFHRQVVRRSAWLRFLLNGKDEGLPRLQWTKRATTSR
jgi:glucan biosynthesis protein C